MKKILLSIVVALLINFANAQWQTSGPYGSSITCFAVTGTNIFAGAGDGTFLSTNNGTSWTRVNTGLPANTWVRALAASGPNIFAGIDSNGVYLSTNNGGNWTAVNTGLPVTYPLNTILSLAISGSNIFAGTYSGVYLSTNNGSNWTAVNTGLPTGVWGQTSVIALAISGTNIFAGTENGMYVSTNNGGNWTPINISLADTIVTSFAISGSNIFAGTYSGVYLSTNNGGNWTQIIGATDVYSLALSGSNIFGAGSLGVLLSINLGSTWTVVDNGLPYQVCVNSLAINGTTVFAGIGDYVDECGSGVWQQSLADITTGLQEIKAPESTQFKLYPNPANSSFIIETTATDEQLMQVFDMTGKLLLVQNIENSITIINTTGLPVGIYTVSLKSADGMVTKKLVVEK